jgi:hypothetical protein
MEGTLLCGAGTNVIQARQLVAFLWSQIASASREESDEVS